MTSKEIAVLDTLAAVERGLPALLRDEGAWKSLLVDYHPPTVERLWRPWGAGRVYLHRIHPCARAEALFHPHPWPSAMRVLIFIFGRTTATLRMSLPRSSVVML